VSAAEGGSDETRTLSFEYSDRISVRQKPKVSRVVEGENRISL